jgi:hypothetical protein
MKGIILGLLFSCGLYSVNSYAWDCDTNCTEETRVCTTTIFGKICTPPEPTAYATCMTIKANSCAAREAENLFKNASSVFWGEAGRGGYPVAATAMLSRNPVFEPLDPLQMDFLSRFFDVGFLSQLRIHYYASLMDMIGVQPFTFNIINSHTEAQTFGADIYVAGPKRSPDCGQYALLAHEIQHSAQALSLGGYHGFGYEYFYQFKQAGLNYEQMRSMGLEGEAYALQAKVQRECR